MAETEKFQNIDQHNISVGNNFPKDLLQRFVTGHHFSHKLNGGGGEGEEEEEEDVELSLGLSLNGRFGVDPIAPKKLTRSSSIPDFINPTRENGSPFVFPNMASTSASTTSTTTTNLARTCSLPTEIEEEWRRKKEMQTLRRMEAKRKRFEKQRNLKAVKDRNRGSEKESCEDDHKRENGVIGNHQQRQFVKNQFVKNFNGLFIAGMDRVLPQMELATTLSQGSQGTGSSGMSESESQPVQGMNKCTEASSPASVQSLSECEQKSVVAPGLMTINDKSGSPALVAIEKNGSNKPTAGEIGAKEMVRNVLEDMPCVSTKGEGPNGKRIEGFLYQYRKGEEVRIVCVCHGSFLSPAEFVKHAGGGDVAQPLKHIVVNPSSFL